MNADIIAMTRAVVADPGDDLARLAYADACEEAGHPLRTEFVRLQVRLAKAKAAVLPMPAIDRYLVSGDTLYVRADWTAMPWARPGDLVRLADGFCVEVAGYEVDDRRCVIHCKGETYGPVPDVTHDPGDRSREYYLLHEEDATWLPEGWSPWKPKMDGGWRCVGLPAALIRRGFVWRASLPSVPTSPLPPVASELDGGVRVSGAVPRQMPFGGVPRHHIYGWLRGTAEDGRHAVPERICRHFDLDLWGLDRVLSSEGVWYVGEEASMLPALSHAILAWSAVEGWAMR